MRDHIGVVDNHGGFYKFHADTFLVHEDGDLTVSLGERDVAAFARGQWVAVYIDSERAS